MEGSEEKKECIYKECNSGKVEDVVNWLVRYAQRGGD